MGYGIYGGNSFQKMYQGQMDSTLKAASLMRPGTKTVTEGPGKTPLGAAGTMIGFGMAGAQAAPTVAGLLGLGGTAAAAAGTSSAAGTTAAGATAGAPLGPAGIAVGAGIGALLGLTMYLLS